MESIYIAVVSPTQEKEKKKKKKTNFTPSQALLLKALRSTFVSSIPW